MIFGHIVDPRATYIYEPETMNSRRYTRQSLVDTGKVVRTRIPIGLYSASRMTRLGDFRNTGIRFPVGIIRIASNAVGASRWDSRPGPYIVD